MGKFELISFASDEELARAAAASWLRDIESANRVGAAHRAALSGGRIARKFFAATAEHARAGNVSLGLVDFFWADERCVPPDNSESNYALASQFLFTPLTIASSRIHRIRGEAAPDDAAAEAEAEICRIAPLNADGQPVLDLIFLGMGEDGHVASLFPGELEAVMRGKSVYRAVTAAKPPPHRITLDYRAIAAARQVWVLASGPGKEAALAQSLDASGHTPLARVLGLRQHTRIFTDIRRD